MLAALAVSTSAFAQNPYQDDLICRQYADAQIAPMRDQANQQAVGSALLGAGLGAALGAAAGGGRGAGIGAASGAILGTGVGAANAQNATAYLQQQYNALYANCMASRRPPPAYSAQPSYPPAGYAQPGYAPQGYAPPARGGDSANQLNRQELDRVQGAPPAGYAPPGYGYPPSGYYPR